MSEHLLNWLGGTLQRKFQLAAFAFILGFTLAVPDFESLNENDPIDNDQAVLCVNEVVPGNDQERVESRRNKLFSVENPRFSSSPLFAPPTKAGRNLLQLLRLQKK